MKLSLAVVAAAALALSACASTETVIATQAVTLSCTYVKSTNVEKAAGGLEVEVPTTVTVSKTATTVEDAAAAIKETTGDKPCTQVSVNAH
ncbi:MAG: hypothetical protein ACOH12_03495 [Parvibaculaceae bacterium]